MPDCAALVACVVCKFRVNNAGFTGIVAKNNSALIKIGRKIAEFRVGNHGRVCSKAVIIVYSLSVVGAAKFRFFY